MDIQSIKKRFYAMETEAQQWIPIWQDLALYTKPTRGFFYDDRPNFPRTVNTKKMLSSHASQAIRILAAGMTSGLTSPSRPWFKLRLSDKSLMQFQEVKVWLEIVEKLILEVFAKSNMYGVYYNIYEEIAAFGTASALMVEDFQSAIRGRSFTIGEYYLATDSAGRVNAFGRSYNMTVYQVVQEFGIDNVSESVRSMYKSNNVDQWVKVCHLIERNDDRVPWMFNNKNMTFRSVYFEKGSSDNVFLKISGFGDFPALCPRWDTITTADVYGKGPSWEAIGDIKMHQQMERKKLEALDKMVNPPLLVDGSIDGEVNILPGGITRSSSTNPTMGMRAAYEVRPDLQALQFAINEVKMDISKAFYSDLFLMISNSGDVQKTATEIATRQEEKLIMLGRVLTQLQNELLDPSISRAFNILVNTHMIPEPPKELQGLDLQVDYISILAQAQKMVGTRSIEQAMGFIGNVVAVKPDVMDNIDVDRAVLEYADMLGVPPSIIRPPEQVKMIRDERAQAIQQQQDMQNAMATVQGAKVLSETKVGQASALENLLGVGPTGARR
jgi:hypothetical protein